ncbi:MAG TPA: dihydrolipoamide acetyltransferase family protein, partial [Ktedonobacterales bacterium]
SPALHPVWRIMAERTTQSWREVPHFFLMREINATRLIAWRDQLRRQRDLSVTYTDLLVMATAHTLRQHPRVNASWREGAIIQHPEIHVALAVAAEYGLVTPVIRQADQLTIAQITARRRELVERAQAGKQRADDLAGATFTISNLGMYGVDAFNAIVPAPQAAILAVGRIVERVVPLHGAPAVQPMMALSLSCDHRVIDGARGAEFLGALADLLEEPLALLE